jgi:heme exporter protein D
MFYIWLAIAFVGMVFLIINLVLYSKNNTVVLIAVINAISGI